MNRGCVRRLFRVTSESQCIYKAKDIFVAFSSTFVVSGSWFLFSHQDLRPSAPSPCFSTCLSINLHISINLWLIWSLSFWSAITFQLICQLIAINLCQTVYPCQLIDKVCRRQCCCLYFPYVFDGKECARHDGRKLVHASFQKLEPHAR